MFSIDVVFLQDDGGIDVDMDDSILEDSILEDIGEGMNDDTLNVNADEDQLLTEDVSRKLNGHTEITGWQAPSIFIKSEIFAFL